MSGTRGRSRPVRYARFILAVVFALSTMAFASVASAEWTPASIQRITNPDPMLDPLPNDGQYRPDMSTDGQYVAFESYATNLVAGDENGYMDVFSCNAETGVTTLVSVSSAGEQANYESSAPSTSGDGRYVAFCSYASNLVDGDTNGNYDIFVRDLVSEETTRVSIASDGSQANGSSYHPSISDDGRYVAFYSYASNLVAGDTNSRCDVFVHDMVSGTNILVSDAPVGTQSNGDSYNPDLSGDGTCVAFYSWASNLVPNDTNGQYDVFMRNIASAETTLVSQTTSGVQGNNGSYDATIDEDGSVVTWSSWASNLVPGDTNSRYDVFARDMTTGETSRASVASDGTQSDGDAYSPEISGNGEYVTFYSYASNLVADDTNNQWDIFRHDIASGETIRISIADDEEQGYGYCEYSAISGDGQTVAFRSYSANLVDGDWNGEGDLFVRDVPAASTVMLCRTALEQEVVTEDSEFARVSADGRYVVFHSYAGNLIPNDENDDNDVFCYDRDTGDLELISVSSEGVQGQGCSTKPSISADGRYVVFQSSAENLVDNDGNDDADIFLRDRVAGTTIRISTRMAGVDIEDEDSECANWPYINSEGTRIVYRSAADDVLPGYDISYPNIFVYDIASGETTIASVSNDGDYCDEAAHWPTLSADGRYVAFRTSSVLTTDPITPCDNGCMAPQIYVRDLQTGVTINASLSLTDATGNGGSRWASLSGDGQYVAFQSGADDLVENDNNDSADIFVRDLASNETTRVSISTDGEEGDDCSSNPAISADGRYVTFASDASNLVDDDTNGYQDIFVHDMATGETERVNVSLSGVEADGDGDEPKPSISADGSVIALDTEAGNLVDGAVIDTHGRSQIYVYDTNVAPQAVSVAGSDRYETAVETSKMMFPDGADTAVIATGCNWPDALGGAALAGVLNGPILLVDTNAIPACIAGEIARLNVQDVVILGGEQAVSAGVFNTLSAQLGASHVERIGGLDRYQTAERVAATTVALLGEDYDGTAFVATGNNFADALSASPLASAAGWPVYLSSGDGVSASTLAGMQAVGVTDAVLLGGEAAVTPDTMVTILGAGITAVRIDGANRYETATKVAQYGVDTIGLDWNGVAITTGEDFPDALTGGAAQGSAGSVMLLTPPTALCADTATCLETHKSSIDAVVYLGGTNAVSTAVRNSVSAIIN